jgi:hypothetical protein
MVKSPSIITGAGREAVSGATATLLTAIGAGAGAAGASAALVIATVAVSEGTSLFTIDLKAV